MESVRVSEYNRISNIPCAGKIRYLIWEYSKGRVNDGPRNHVALRVNVEYDDDYRNDEIAKYDFSWISVRKWNRLCSLGISPQSIIFDHLIPKVWKRGDPGNIYRCYHVTDETRTEIDRDELMRRFMKYDKKAAAEMRYHDHTREEQHENGTGNHRPNKVSG